MGYAAIPIPKMKSHNLKIIQFRNQRGGESKRNDDIDQEGSHKNCDFVNNGNVDYKE